MTTLTEEERRCLQGHARRALEGLDRGRGAREGEAVWHTPYPARAARPWTPETLRRLEERGLIRIREEWKDNFVRVTEEAFALLGSGRGVGSGS